MKRYLLILIVISAPLFAGAFSYAEEVFTWEDCVREAAKNNPDLVSAKESVNSASADKSITASGLFPQVSASAGVSKSKSGGASGSSSSNSSTNNYNYGVNGSQLIFDGFNTANKVNAAAENIKAAQESYKFTS
ncbi:MAG: TolC family protein, partial [Candidatus Omnitrophota bacterium]